MGYHRPTEGVVVRGVLEWRSDVSMSATGWDLCWYSVAAPPVPLPPPPVQRLTVISGPCQVEGLCACGAPGFQVITAMVNSASSTVCPQHRQSS
eukprot:5449364-Prymnesium_polylepis.2